ncbi:MAG: hypothetical protein A2X81_19165 [Desulfobacterales bacterium GWB2_56_26]|nr:MAG: hypothetical protein A2X81_19165 [Desulfobacterales bacterium GWB2_56_26]
MMFGEPHLVIHRTGTSAQGNKSIQMKIGQCFYVVETVGVGSFGNRPVPIITFQVESLQFWFITPQQVLGIAYPQLVLFFQSKYECGTALP